MGVDFVLESIVPRLLPALYHVKMMKYLQIHYQTPEKFANIFRTNPRKVPGEIWKIIPSEAEIRVALGIAGYAISKTVVPASAALYNASPDKIQRLCDGTAAALNKQMNDAGA